MEIPWSKPDLGIEERMVVQNVLDSGWASMGPETEAFERDLATYLGCKHVVAVNNGTSALLCALLAHPIEDVVVPAYTFPATWNAVRVLRKSLYFRDVDPTTFQMTPDVNSSTAILNIPVSVAGMPLDAEVWKRHVLVEDACESLGAQARGWKTGNQGWPTCFSFHVAKLVTTIEGGCIATDDTEYAMRCALIRSHGENPEQKYDYVATGLNFRPTDLASAIGRVQLKKLPQYLDNRHRIATYYHEALEGKVMFQAVPDYVDVHANMMFPILVDEPDGLAAKLKEKGIETRRPWPPGYDLPGAQAIYTHVLALPIYNTMTLEEAEYVTEAVRCT